RKDVDAAQLDHVVASAKELVHPAEAAAAGTRPVRDYPNEIAHVVANDRRDIAVQDRDDGIADLAIGNRLAGVDILDLQENAILHDMKAVLILALEGRRTHLVRAVVVIDRTAPQVLKLVAQRIVGVGAKVGADQLGVQFADVAAKFIAGDLCKLSQIFRE